MMAPRERRKTLLSVEKHRLLGSEKRAEYMQKVIDFVNESLESSIDAQLFAALEYSQISVKVKVDNCLRARDVLEEIKKRYTDGQWRVKLEENDLYSGELTLIFSYPDSQ